MEHHQIKQERALRSLNQPRDVSGTRNALALPKLMSATEKLAQEMAAGPQVAMRLLKRAVYNAAEMSWLQALDDIAGKTSVVDHHSDAVEGVAAFKEKRMPEFNKWLS